MAKAGDDEGAAELVQLLELLRARLLFSLDWSTLSLSVLVATSVYVKYVFRLL